MCNISKVYQNILSGTYSNNLLNFNHHFGEFFFFFFLLSAWDKNEKSDDILFVSFVYHSLSLNLKKDKSQKRRLYSWTV